MHWFSDWWVHWPRWREVFTLGLDSAVHLGDIGRQAEFLNYIAWTDVLPWRDGGNALEYAERALDLARQAGDVLQEAWAQHYIASAHQKLGDLRGALDAARVADELFERAGDVDAGCQSLLLHGDLALEQGDPAEALAGYQRALGLVNDPTSGMTPTIAEGTFPVVLGRVARALGRLGRADEGVPLALRAADLLGRMQFLLPQARTLQMLADELYDDEPRRRGPRQSAPRGRCLRDDRPSRTSCRLPGESRREGRGWQFLVLHIVLHGPRLVRRLAWNAKRRAIRPPPWHSGAFHEHIQPSATSCWFTAASSTDPAGRPCTGS